MSPNKNNQVKNHPITTYQAGAYKEGAIKLSANESRFGISPHVLESIKNNASMVFQYPDSRQSVLREKIASHLDIKKESLILGNGSDEVISFICQSLLEQGDSTLSAKETFSVYKIASEIAKVSHTTIPLKGGFFDLEHIQYQCNKNPPKILFLCNPNNPTGTYHPPHSIKALLETIPHSVFVVLDEAYIDFVDETIPDYKSVSLEEKLSWHPNIIILRTFSKLFGLGGLRLGIGISNTHLAETIERIRMPFNINHIVQSAARTTLEDMPFYNTVRSIIMRERTRLQTSIAKTALQQNIQYYPSQANFICYTLGDDNNKEPISHRLYEFFESHNIMIRALTSFGMPNAVRITIGTPEENDMVMNILSQYFVMGGTRH